MIHLLCGAMWCSNVKYLEIAIEISFSLVICVVASLLSSRRKIQRVEIGALHLDFLSSI